MAYLPVLFKIQEIRNRLNFIEKSIAEVHQDSALAALKIQEKELSQKLAEIEANQGLNRKTQSKLDLELKSRLEKLQHEETKLYNGSVVNARELEQIQQKVSEYHKSKSQLEDELIKLMEEAEQLEDLKSQMIQAYDLCRQKMSQLEKELERKVAEFKLESMELNSEVDGLLPLVPNEWFEKFERIARSHKGIGIAQIKSGCCGACHVTLPESLLQKAKRGEDQLLLCENCGRIIFY